MPFTAAHPSIFLPWLRSRKVSATALVTGSMAPDFEYFLKMDTGSEHSHTVAGLFYFSLPMTLVLSIIFHRIIRKPLMANLPAAIQDKCAFNPDFDFTSFIRKRYLTFIWCALLAAGSHILWDRFTHNGWFARNLEIYQMISLRVGDLNYPLFFILQQLSTAAGCFAILVYFIASPPIYGQKIWGNAVWWYWPATILITIGGSFIRLGIPDLESQHGAIIVTLIAAFMGGLTITSMIARKFTRV